MKAIIISFLTLISILSCSFSQKIKDGETAYERKQYYVASELLLDEYESVKSESSKARKAFLLGRSYLKLQEYSEALYWFKKSVALNYGPEALGNLATTYKMMEEYEAAIATYNILSQKTGRKQENDREVLMCMQAIASKSVHSDYLIEKIFENSGTSDYGPVLFENDFLLFTSERSESSGNGIYNWTGEKFSDIFIVRKSGSDIKRFDSAINTEENEGTCWFSKDMNTVIFTRCYSFDSGDDFCKLMISKRDNRVWSEPEVLPFINDKINYGQATFIENDSVLVFSSDLMEPGGSLDLYYTELSGDGTWSLPEKLPSSINSSGNEKFPTGDGDTLYFSSDFWQGLGGFDIFKTYLRKDGSWSVPINIGYPVNSGGDDFSLIVDYSAKRSANILQQGYFSSSRYGNGKDDIYRFKKLIPMKEPDTISKTEKEPVSIFVTVKTFMNDFEVKEDPNSKVIGRRLLGDSYIKIVDGNNLKVVDGYTDQNGFYFTQIDSEKLLKVIASKLDFLNASKEFTTKNLVFKEGENTLTINIELLLDRIYTDKEINLSNIYYDYDKWDIKDVAKPTL
ncbi:MAG: tetratricopeptide repeat protein, partial [Saprospiraceae bacterium]|nr:tetratricopeptide repeat protein [Saprospiraceae bacterium]